MVKRLYYLISLRGYPFNTPPRMPGISSISETNIKNRGSKGDKPKYLFYPAISP